MGCADILYKEKPPVILWGESYAIETTFVLILNDKELFGPIPPGIGNLINLTTLDLSKNQLTGIIPNEICNQGDNYPTLENNQLCPP